MTQLLGNQVTLPRSTCLTLLGLPPVTQVLGWSLTYDCHPVTNQAFKKREPFTWNTPELKAFPRKCQIHKKGRNSPLKNASLS